MKPLSAQPDPVPPAAPAARAARAAPRIPSLGASRSLPQRLSAGFVGLAFTYLLFTGIGLLQRQEPEAPAPALEDLSDIIAPPPPPPPPPPPNPLVPQPQQDSAPLDLIGFEISRTESPVSIAALPMPLDTTQASIIPPTAYIRSDLGSLAIKPSLSTEALETQRVFSGSDVDQRAAPIFKKKPRIYGTEFSHLQTTRINVLFVVDTKGKVGSLRVLRSTGDAVLDQRMLDALKQWEFTPAIRRGKPVRQWFEQLINVEFSSNSLFYTN